MAKTMRIYPKKTVRTQPRSEMNMKIVESGGNDLFVSKNRQEGCQTNQIKSAKSMQLLRAFPCLFLLVASACALISLGNVAVGFGKTR